jgi:hypothetical protein
MHSPDRDTHLAAIADEQAKADARRRALDRRAADLVATLRVVIEALEGHAETVIALASGQRRMPMTMRPSWARRARPSSRPAK